MAHGREGASRHRLDDGRWHFQHGPIDLIMACSGDDAACEASFAGAWARFQDVLAELVPHLGRLRSPVWGDGGSIGPIANRMIAACLPYAQRFGLFITPMAAVAGSVADEIIGCFARPGVLRAYVNNGGDIALYLTAGHHYDVGMVTDLQVLAIDGRFRIDAASAIRGIATSGWQGRSFSLGIADSVTVLAQTGAIADAAATMVANHVDVASREVQRQPASSLRDDTDLGERLVTVAVGDLTDEQIATALAAGEAFAERLRRESLIAAAALSLRGHTRVVRSR